MKQRYYFIDNLRWVTVVLVLIYHVFYNFNAQGVFGGIGGFCEHQWWDTVCAVLYPWMMPLMSLWIGFTVPVALSLYWFAGGVVRMLEDLVLTKKFRKVYDAEDAERLKKFMAEEALEEEKERIRAEKRAANPDGITANTSKKKLLKQQQAADEAAKLAAKKEYDAKRGIAAEEEPEKQVMSGIPERPYCKGRNYDPDRYSRETTEE